jgi:hypothetical protein
MIDKLNITIQNKESKVIYYTLNLDLNYWYKSEYNAEGNITHSNDISGYWSKREYDSKGKRIYYETSYGYIEDDK